MNRLMAAFLRADCPRAADIIRAGRETAVLAFAISPADRMNRRQVQHRKSQLGNVRKTRHAIAQGAVFSRLIGAGTRKALVPAAELGQWLIDDNPKLLIVTGGPAPVRVLAHERRQLLIECRLNGLGLLRAKRCRK